MKRTLREYFTYHPPKTEERKKAHERVNKAAYDFAQVIARTVDDDSLYAQCIQQIQMARMLANQAITFEELDNKKAEIVDRETRESLTDY